MSPARAYLVRKAQRRWRAERSEAQLARSVAIPIACEFELLRVGGASLDALARGFSVSRDSVQRHCRHHLSDRRRAELTCGPAKVEQLANAAADKSKSLLDYLGITRSVLFSQFLNAAEAGDRNGVATVAGRLLEALRELGRLSGELRQISGLTINNNTLNVIATPEFTALCEGLLDFVRNHPEMRGEILALLDNLDAATPAVLSPNRSTYPDMIEAEAVSE